MKLSEAFRRKKIGKMRLVKVYIVGRQSEAKDMHGE